MSQRYSQEIKEFIRDNVKGTTTKNLTKLVNDRFGNLFTEATMKSYKANNNLKSGTPLGNPKGLGTKVWPLEVQKFIKENVLSTGHQAMADMLNEKFGTHYTKDQIKGFYANRKLNSGLTGRFEKGTIPPNKGHKGECAPGCEAGWFPQGNFPHNRKPVGSELVRADGYLWVKIQDGKRNGNWREKHRILWEEHNGPIPKGHMITFLDGDPMNITIKNLALITKRENQLLNKKGMRSGVPEVTAARLNLAKVKIAISDRTKKKKGPNMKCSQCQYLRFEKGNGNPNRYYCIHPKITAAMGYHLISRTDRYSTVLKTKTSPRWCPLRERNVDE